VTAEAGEAGRKYSPVVFCCMSVDGIQSLWWKVVSSVATTRAAKGRLSRGPMGRPASFSELRP
jgi:hypothetical protein